MEKKLLLDWGLRIAIFALIYFLTKKKIRDLKKHVSHLLVQEKYRVERQVQSNRLSQATGRFFGHYGYVAFLANETTAHILRVTDAVEDALCDYPADKTRINALLAERINFAYDDDPVGGTIQFIFASTGSLSIMIRHETKTWLLAVVQFVAKRETV